MRYFVKLINAQLCIDYLQMLYALFCLGYCGVIIRVITHGGET